MIIIDEYNPTLTTNVASSNPVYGEVFSIQHYVIMFVSDLRQVGVFLRTLLSTTNKIDRHDIPEILLKVSLNTINQSKTSHLVSFIWLI